MWGALVFDTLRRPGFSLITEEYTVTDWGANVRSERGGVSTGRHTHSTAADTSGSVQGEVGRLKREYYRGFTCSLSVASRHSASPSRRFALAWTRWADQLFGEPGAPQGLGLPVTTVVSDVFIPDGK